MHWDIVARNFDYLLIGGYPKGPLGGLAMTAILAVGGIFGAFWLGLGIGLMRIAKSRRLRWPAMGPNMPPVPAAPLPRFSGDAAIRRDQRERAIDRLFGHQHHAQRRAFPWRHRRGPEKRRLEPQINRNLQPLPA